MQIFRHGDRTPDKKVIYKNDPFINETYYPFGNGQLTNEGKRKEYGIGKALRKKYSHFLGDFTLDIVDSRCTDYNRTKMSLQLVLASLFPPTGKHVWEKKLKWQPVPFNYWPVDEDHVLGDPHANCPRFQDSYLKFLNSSEGQKLYENFTEIIKHLELKTGQRLYSKSFAELYFTLTTESEYGLDIPEWSKAAYPFIKHLAILDYNTSSATDLQKRLSTGFFIKKIIDDSVAKSKGKEHEHTKIFLYSAHESNIAAVLRFLGIFYNHIPPYGSYITFEIHNVKGVRGIKVYYQDYSSEKPKKYKIPNCETFCTLERFELLYKHLLPESDQECFVATSEGRIVEEI
nr:venom acid phosphatase Acph-1-like [Leptinotarsa decemlineata]